MTAVAVIAAWLTVSLLVAWRLGAFLKACDTPPSPSILDEAERIVRREQSRLTHPSYRGDK